VIVADTNLISYLLLEGEHTANAEQVLHRDSHWIAPLLWRSEFRNVLALYMRQDLLPLEQAYRLMGLGEALMAGREYSQPSNFTLELAANSRCAAYDCEFVALAHQKEVPLVTSDRKVLAAFPEVAVAPQKFVGRPRDRRR
jgi:predicted nucleic acid-binding protein